jgi:hypothetical protein
MICWSLLQKHLPYIASKYLPRYLPGSDAVLGFGGGLATSANERESTVTSLLIIGGAWTGCIGGQTASMSIGLIKHWFHR